MVITVYTLKNLSGGAAVLVRAVLVAKEVVARATAAAAAVVVEAGMEQCA